MAWSLPYKLPVSFAPTPEKFDGTNNVLDSTSGYVFPSRRTTESLPTTAIDTNQHYYGVRDMAGPSSLTLHATTYSDKVTYTYRDFNVEV